MAFAPPSAFGAEIPVFQLDGGTRRTRRPPSHGRMVTSEEVSGAILYLANPTSASTTGTALEVDGGVHNMRVRQPRPSKG